MVTFIVEKKNGKMPDIVWQKVFERQLPADWDSHASMSAIADSLHVLYFGSDYRVVIIC